MLSSVTGHSPRAREPWGLFLPRRITVGLLGLFPAGAPSVAKGQVFAASQWPIAEWEEVIGGSGLPVLGALLCFLPSLILEQFTQSDP